MAQFQTYNFPAQIAGSYYKGTTFKFYSDVARTIPIDLTGCVVKMQIKTDYRLAVVKTFSTDDNSIVLTDAVNGVIDIAPCNMDVPDGLYLYDIDFTFPTDINKVYLKGTWQILPKVTTK